MKDKELYLKDRSEYMAYLKWCESEGLPKVLFPEYVKAFKLQYVPPIDKQ